VHCLDKASCAINTRGRDMPPRPSPGRTAPLSRKHAPQGILDILRQK